MNNTQFKQARRPNESLHNLCRWLMKIALINFGLFFVVSMILGGDAVNGHESAGRYYLANRGTLIEVSYFTFTFSKLHVYSVFITHPLAIIGSFIYSLTGGKKEDFWQSNPAPKEKDSALLAPAPVEPRVEPQAKTSKMILLEFRDNGTGYEDIVLLLNDEEYLADSYYFVLDQEYSDSKEGAIKIKAVLRLLLEQWLELISIQNFQTAYLPYAFYDRCTGWLRCDHDDGRVTIQHGWSDIEGWSFLPSSIKATARAVDDFQADSLPISMDLDRLQAAIRFSINNID